MSLRSLPEICLLLRYSLYMEQCLNSTFLLSLFRDNNGISQALELVHSQIART